MVPENFLLSEEFSNATLTVSHSREKREEGESVSKKKCMLFSTKNSIENDWLPFSPLRPNLVLTLGPGSPSSHRAVSTSAFIFSPLEVAGDEVTKR